MCGQTHTLLRYIYTLTVAHRCTSRYVQANVYTVYHTLINCRSQLGTGFIQLIYSWQRSQDPPRTQCSLQRCTIQTLSHASSARYHSTFAKCTIQSQSHDNESGCTLEHLNPFEGSQALVQSKTPLAPTKSSVRPSPENANCRCFLKQKAIRSVSRCSVAA